MAFGLTRPAAAPVQAVVFEGAPRARRARTPRSGHQSAWWKVMCLTGVDYFSTLGYQPGIAFLAAGPALAARDPRPRAADAVRRAADVSPRRGAQPARPGQHLDARGAAAAMARQGARALPARVCRNRLHHHDHAVGRGRDRAHRREPAVAASLVNHPVLLTLVLLAGLGAIFLKGFREAVGLAVPIVGIYLLLNVVVVVWGLHYLWAHPECFPAMADRWRSSSTATPLQMIACRPAPVPEAGARAVGLRNRCRGDAARPGRPGRHAAASGRAGFATRRSC